MSVFELLTDEDKTLIEQYVEDFAPTYHPDLRTILKEWDSKKSEDLEKLFGNKLILHRPYTYAISEEGLFKEFEILFMKNRFPLQNMRNAFYRLPYTHPNLKPYEDFFLDLLSASTLVPNSYQGNAFSFVFDDGEVFKISKGMKPMKIVHKICNKYYPQYLEPEGDGRESLFE